MTYIFSPMCGSICGPSTNSKYLVKKERYSLLHLAMKLAIIMLSKQHAALWCIVAAFNLKNVTTWLCVTHWQCHPKWSTPSPSWGSRDTRITGEKPRKKFLWHQNDGWEIQKEGIAELQEACKPTPPTRSVYSWHVVSYLRCILFLVLHVCPNKEFYVCHRSIRKQSRNLINRICFNIIASLQPQPPVKAHAWHPLTKAFCSVVGLDTNTQKREPVDTVWYIMSNVS